MRAAATVLALLAPVGGPVTRGFDYGPDPFLAGQHRGIDLTAPPGVVVRAACSGTVAVARLAVVTLRCGGWRVTELPLTGVEVRVATRVRAGEVVGRAGVLAGHAGLHLGVRRAGDAFGYVDPAPLLRGAAARPPVVSPPARVPRGGPRPSAPRARPDAAADHAAPADGAARNAAPGHAAVSADRAPARAVRPTARRAARRRRAHAAPAAAAAPARPTPRPRRRCGCRGCASRGSLRSSPGGVRVPADAASGALAPWPAWVGLALLVLGAVGGGVRIGVRRRISRLAEPAAEGVPSAP